MALLTESMFFFESRSGAVAPDTFAVVSFTGRESLSQLFEFNLELISENRDIDAGDILANPAVFTITRPNGEEAVSYTHLTLPTN